MNKTRLINKSILIRTVKTALAALLSIIVSQELSLDFAAAAGIIAILNIFETRKSTIEGGLKRTLSAVIALVIGGLLFEYFGYNTWVFGLYLLIFVPISFLLKIELGLGPSSVIVTHLLAFGEINSGIILNEMALVFIGTGFAMLTNFYAPNRQDELNKIIKNIDEDMKYVLNLFGTSLVKNFDVEVYEHKISELDEDIKRAINLAVLDSENYIENSNDLLYRLQLRAREIDLLEDMYYDLKTIPVEYSDGDYIADLFTKASKYLNEGGNIAKVKKRIEYLKNHFHMMKLPETHEEFAIRSAIFQVFKSIDEFIDISDYINNKLKY